MAVGDVCRQVGISEQTFYRWKKVYGGMLSGEARELKQLREENTKLKRLVACRWIRSCYRTSSKKVLKPVKQREVMHYLMGRYGVSQRRAARAARFCRSSLRYESRRNPLTALRSACGNSPRPACASVTAACW